MHNYRIGSDNIRVSIEDNYKTLRRPLEEPSHQEKRVRDLEIRILRIQYSTLWRIAKLSGCLVLGWVSLRICLPGWFSTISGGIDLDLCFQLNVVINPIQCIQ